MEEHIDEFVAETEDELVNLSNSLVELENSSGDEEVLDEVFRISHTLKGTFAAMGFGEPHEVAHAMEDVLDEIRAGELDVTPELVDVLFEGVTALEDSLDSIEESGEVTRSYRAIVEEIESELEGDQGERDSDGEESGEEELDAEKEELDEEEDAGEGLEEEVDREEDAEEEEGPAEEEDTEVEPDEEMEMEMDSEEDLSEEEEVGEAVDGAGDAAEEDDSVEQGPAEEESAEEDIDGGEGAPDIDSKAIVVRVSDEGFPDGDSTQILSEMEDRDDIQVMETKPERGKIEAGEYEESFRVVAETEEVVDVEEFELDRADSVTVIEDDVGLLHKEPDSEGSRGYFGRILSFFDVRRFFSSEEAPDDRPEDGSSDGPVDSPEAGTDVDDGGREEAVDSGLGDAESPDGNLAVINVEAPVDGKTPDDVLEDIERAEGVAGGEVNAGDGETDDGDSVKVVARVEADVDPGEIDLDHDASITLVEDDVGIVNDTLGSIETESGTKEDDARDTGSAADAEEEGDGQDTSDGAPQDSDGSTDVDVGVDGDAPVLEVTVSDDGFPAAAAVAVLDDLESTDGFEIGSTDPDREALEEGEYEESFQVALASGDPSEVEASDLRKAEHVEARNTGSETEQDTGGSGSPDEDQGSTSASGSGEEDAASSGLGGSEVGDEDTTGSLESSGDDQAIKSVSVDVEQLDEMMSNVNELVITKIQMQHAVERRDYEQLRKRSDKLDKLSEKMRDDIMDARLVPLRKITGKYPRIVRDVARKEGKEVEFEVEGEDIELDRSILENLKDPIVHLLKNSVDHGIETPEERAEAGKPESGKVVLEAERYQDRVEIQIRDDGAGLDADEIRDKAVERDVVSRQEADRMPDDEVYDLVLESGFSTKEEVTDTSGRGVGLNAVQEAIQENDGSITISSDPGEGTVVTLTLPIDITVVDAMLIGVDGRKYAVPMKAVSAISSREDAEIDRIQGQEVCVVDEEPRPLIDLPKKFAADGGGEADGGMVVHVRENVREASIECSEVYGQQEIVVQPFEGALAEVNTFSGTAILGEGEVVPVLEVNEL